MGAGALGRATHAVHRTVELVIRAQGFMFFGGGGHRGGMHAVISFLLHCLLQRGRERAPICFD
jgi:hypothetical protein